LHHLQKLSTSPFDDGGNGYRSGFGRKDGNHRGTEKILCGLCVSVVNWKRKI
jgi:hypothetical protein